MKIWLSIKASCLIAVSVFACIALWQANLTLRSARAGLAELPDTLQNVNLVAGKASTAIDSLNDTTKALKGTISAVNGGLGAETQLLQASTKQLGKTEYAFRSLIDHTDKSINQPVEGLLPRLTDTVRQAADTVYAFKSTVVTANDALLEVKSTVGAADAVISDPAIKQSVDHFADTAKNTADLTASGAATMAKVQQGVTYEVDQLMKPVKKAKAIALFMADLARHALGW